MRRRSFLVLASLLPAAFISSRFGSAGTPEQSQAPNYLELAMQLNELAANVQTPLDARRLVDFVSKIFEKELPPAWATESLRDRIAQAEYLAVSGEQDLIPEQRLAEAWNAYVGSIHAPAESRVTAAEIHNLRDSFFTTGRLLWDRGNHNIWFVPAIYAVGPDGKLAVGCRAIEAFRLLWDLANMPDNIKGTRHRVQEGLLASQKLAQAERRSESSSRSQVLIQGGVISNPVEIAKREYIHSNGVLAYSDAVTTMLHQVIA